MTRWILAVAVLVGCKDDGEPAQRDASAGPIVDAAPALDAARYACTPGGETKLAFTRETGCVNDGSVELCYPAARVAEVLAIAPAATCHEGAGGRARCHERPGHALCMIPTRVPEECAEHHGALNDDGWSLVCGLAALPDVTEIVHTFYE